MNTDALISELSSCPDCVGRLRSPWTRALAWFGIAIPYGTLIVLLMSPRDDLATVWMEPRFALEQTAMLITAVIAATAAFSLTIPGRSKAPLILLAPPLAVWLVSLGVACVAEWLGSGTRGLVFQIDWICFPSIVIIGTVPAAVMTVMLGRGAPLLPRSALALGALAAAAFGNFGLRLFHVQEAGLMMLVWQFGTVMLITALGGFIGPRILRWRHAAVA